MCSGILGVAGWTAGVLWWRKAGCCQRMWGLKREDPEYVTFKGTEGCCHDSLWTRDVAEENLL